MSLSLVRDSAESPVLVLVPVGQLSAHPDNPRRSLGELAELTRSVAVQGVLEPLLVVPVGVFNTAAGAGRQISDPAVRWVIVAGHRRHAAAVRAKAETVPAMLRADLADPALALEVMVTENYQRSNLTPVEEAHAFGQLRAAGRSQRDIAARLGCAQSHVSKRLALLDLPEPAQAALDTGRLQLADAGELLRLRKHPDELAAVLAKLLDVAGAGGVWAPGYVANLVGVRLRELDRVETSRRLLAEAARGGARVFNPTDPDSRDGWPGDYHRRHLSRPADIDAARQAGTLGAYIGGDNTVHYLTLGPVDDDQDDGGIRVRRLDPATGEPIDEPGDETWDEHGDQDEDDDQDQDNAGDEDGRQQAGADRRQREQAEIARSVTCASIVRGFVADPVTAVPYLAGATFARLTDAILAEEQDDIDQALIWLHEAWRGSGELLLEEDDFPDVLDWLDRHAQPVLRLPVAGALALAAAERRLDSHTWTTSWDPHDLAHLDRLVAAGHTLTDWEQTRIAVAEQTAGTCTRDDGCAQHSGHPGDCNQIVLADAEVPA